LSGLGIVRESSDQTPEAGLKWYGLCRTTRSKEMKKLMFAAAAAFCGTVFALESANVVGYTEVARPAAFQNSCGGSMFTAVGNDSYSLADLTIAGPTTIANARNNYIMFLQSGTAAKIDKNRTYWYWQGIWRVRTGANPAKDPQLTAEEAAAINIAAGEGFMCNFMHDTTVLNMPTSL
jgi:hypothetical protein